MSMDFRNNAAEITYAIDGRTYRAIESGNHWDVIDAKGVMWKNGITNASRWEASEHLRKLAMRDHDEARHARSSPRFERIVSVDQAGNNMAAPIHGGRRW
jgi:hypothetical protein